MKKRIFYSEIAYIVGLMLLAISVTLMEKSNFGVSMVVAPAYILHKWLYPYFGFFTFGMAEYCLQAVLIIIMVLIMRKFKAGYLFSFITAVIYGFILDGFMFLGAYLPTAELWQRLTYYVLGAIIGPMGVAMMFRTYISPEAYELFVKELSEFFGIKIYKFKTAYDCSSCILSIVLSMTFFGFGKFIGIGWGTVISALINGFIIDMFTRTYLKLWVFEDALPWRKFFTGEKNSPKNLKNAEKI